MEVIIVAIITGVLSGIPSVIATMSSNRKSTTIMEMKIDALDEKVHKHNSLIERTYALEKDVALLKEHIKQ